MEELVYVKAEGMFRSLNARDAGLRLAGSYHRVVVSADGRAGEQFAPALRIPCSASSE